MKTRIININLAITDFWFCLALAAVNFFTKYPYLTARDLSWDEPFSAFYSQFPVSKIITELFKGNNPPFYELFMHFYTAIFGISEFALRMPSLLFSCGTVILLYYTGKRLKGRWAGIFVASLFIFNNLQFFYSLAARMYALFSMLVAASIYLSVLAKQEPDKKNHFYWLLGVNVVMCYTHYFAGFVIVAELIAWLIAFRDKLFFKRTFLVFCINLLLVIPLLLVFLTRASGFVESFGFKPPYPQIWKNMIMNLINGMEIYDAGYAFLAIGLVIYIAISLYRKKIEIRNAYNFVLLFLLFALPLAFTWYYANTYPLFIDRYYLYATLPLFLFTALCISTFYKPISSFLIPVFFFYILNIYHKNFIGFESDYMLREWQAATNTAKKFRESKSNTMILIQPLWADLGFSYYYDRSLFKSPETYNEALAQKNIFRVWSADSLVYLLDKNKGNDLVYYCDENAKVDSTNDGVYRWILRRGYVQDSALVFPVCTTVIHFHTKDSTTGK